MCRGHWLHRYEIAQEYSEGCLEICQICGDKQFFKLIGGRTDNLRYISYHLRQALPIQHKQWIKEYAENI
jgi:hypothetical protein